MRTPALMVLGTGSHAGKSVLAAGLCRLFRQRGLRVAPFKAQNMSLNAAAAEGGEIGRAQAVQAAACGLAPTVDMNPVLLKPTGAGHCQLVLRGRPHGVVASSEHGRYGPEVIDAMLASYQRLARTVDLMLLEGAGSAAEINLLDRDFANGWVAERAGAACLLVADIERGGAFAALYGTWALAPCRKRIRGFVLNKFRGDPSLLEPGTDQLRSMTGVPTLAVVPYLEPEDGPGLPEEDSLALPAPGRFEDRSGKLRIGVLRFPHLANFTDFEPLQDEAGVEVRYIWDAAAMAEADVLILPGTKSTLDDLAHLRACGLDRALRSAAGKGTPLLGVCGGYEMLGREIRDPLQVESKAGAVSGLGYLPVNTVFDPDKRVGRVAGHMVGSDIPIEAYEMHHGRIENDANDAGDQTARAWFHLGGPSGRLEGIRQGRVWGTSLHGLFDSEPFRAYALAQWRHWANKPDVARGAQGDGAQGPSRNGAQASQGDGRAHRRSLEAALDAWAGRLRPHFDLGVLLAWAQASAAQAEATRR